MKKISTSKNFIADDQFPSCSGCESVEMCESEDEEFQCDGCGNGFIVTGMDLAQDFIWHPKRKY
ncbi:MAG: hypothetical protein KJ906_03920 [Nanoarchaeota archaeon]|nr:hypothetical protein [Nanoarchaeota archaeon]